MARSCIDSFLLREFTSPNFFPGWCCAQSANVVRYVAVRLNVRSVCSVPGLEFPESIEMMEFYIPWYTVSLRVEQRVRLLPGAPSIVKKLITQLLFLIFR